MNHPIKLSSEVLRLYPFTSHYMDVNDLAYHYLDEGHGNPVILLHGNPTWSFFYRNVVKTLSSNYRILAPDHIGCGLSAKPSTDGYGFRLEDRVNDLARFIDNLNLGDRLTLVLHDWGGMIGAAWAVENTERVHRIIVLNTAAFLPPENKPIPLRLKMVRDLKIIGTGAVLGFNLFAAVALYMAPTKPLAKTVRAGYLAPYNRPAHRIATLKFVQDIPLVETDPSYARVAHVQANLYRLASIPMMICWGGKDFVFDHDYLAEWQRRFPTAETHLFDRAGHYLLEDESDRIPLLMQSFLQKHPV